MPAPSKKLKQQGDELTKAKTHDKDNPLPFKCDHCEASYARSSALGIHKRAAHGILGRTANKNPNAPKVWGRPKGSKTQKGKTQLAKVSETQTHQALSGQNGFTPHTDDQAHHLEAIATFTAGRITELLTSAAISNDLPPRSLAALVLRTLGQTAKVR